MKLVVMSDSHAKKDRIVELIKKYPGYTYIHLGDYCMNEDILKAYHVIYVNGNCDKTQDNKERIIEVEGKKIWLTHGDLYQVKYSYDRLYLKAVGQQCNAVFFGHTHIQESFKEGEITFLNPGALEDGHYALVIDGKIILK